MDERLENALDFSNFMTTLNAQKRVLYEKFLENCVYYSNGGKFTVSKELINFCHTLSNSQQDSVVLIDDNNMPVQVDDITDFYTQILDLYFTTTNEYIVKFNELKSKRNIEGLVDL